MEIIIEFLKSDIFLLGILAFNVLLLILYIINTLKLSKIKKEYKNFMIKLGEGNNIEEQLKAYMDKVLQVKNENLELKEYCKKMDNQISSCIQKIGLVRYNAFKGMGGNLSFAFALLDYTNTGFVMNSVHSREGCYLYLKRIDMGQTDGPLGNEEKEAVEQALGYVQAKDN